MRLVCEGKGESGNCLVWRVEIACPMCWIAHRSATWIVDRWGVPLVLVMVGVFRDQYV